MSEKKRANKVDFRKKLVRIMCIFMAFLMIFSLIASILALL